MTGEPIMIPMTAMDGVVRTLRGSADKARKQAEKLLITAEAYELAALELSGEIAKAERAARKTTEDAR